MSKDYVTKVEGAYRVTGTRVSLDSLVYLYREGISPEGMAESYPALTLEQVHGALAFYLANQAEVDAYLAKAEAVAAVEHQESRSTNAELIAKLQRMAMRIKFQAGADLDGRVIRGLRRVAPEIDMRTSAEARLAGLEDPEVLRSSAADARILVSQDRSTMPAHFRRFVAESESPGVIQQDEALRARTRAPRKRHSARSARPTLSVLKPPCQKNKITTSGV